MDDAEKKEIRKARRRRLTERLEALRQRVYALEEELKPYTSDFFRVSIFGSARIKPDDEVYKTTEQIARYLGNAGIDVLTGGGPGLMEAANKGVQEGRAESQSKSRSFGLSIQGGFEARPNEHVDIKQHHLRFSSRLDDFMRLSNVFIMTQGGLGTLLELCFSWQLLQVKHLSERPIILVGSSFWTPLIDWMKEKQLGHGMMNAADFRFLSIVDTPEQVMEIVHEEHRKFKEAQAKQVTSGSAPNGQ